MALDLVLGASGYIGTHLVPYLRAKGREVRAASRNPAVLEGRGWNAVQCVRADALDPTTLGAALAGVDTAYYLVHSMAAGEGFDELDARAARTLPTGSGRRAGWQTGWWEGRACAGAGVIPRSCGSVTRWTLGGSRGSSPAGA